jgi:hypothetical protein
MYYQQLIFVWNGFVSLLFFVLSLLALGYFMIKKNNTSVVLLALFLGTACVGLFIHRVPIEADTLLVSPFLVLAFVLFATLIAEKLKHHVISIVLILVVCVLNILFLLSTNFYTKGKYGYRITYKQRMEAVENIIKLSEGRKYAIVGKGELSDFPVFLDPYRYLLWHRGEVLSKGKGIRVIQVWEQERKINISIIKQNDNSNYSL